jgi:hypothetical protein
MSRSADRSGHSKAEEGKWSMEEDFTEMDHGPIARLVAELRDKRPNGDFTLTTDEARKRVMNAFHDEHGRMLRQKIPYPDETEAPKDENA